MLFLGTRLLGLLYPLRQGEALPITRNEEIAPCSWPFQFAASNATNGKLTEK
ncbi:hypothetical protein YSA_06097 [Pseudomonas putida ND6]|uniref:Uncharacterized protein n=1 Tax=Pseudomonas putida ND6 TaxID=231023 RepID=I3UX46_PSEPU|nr:hypothetical protein YSA_06097 [Pseudomonas putida ND6]